MGDARLAMLRPEQNSRETEDGLMRDVDAVHGGWSWWSGEIGRLDASCGQFNATTTTKIFQSIADVYLEFAAAEQRRSRNVGNKVVCI